MPVQHAAVEQHYTRLAMTGVVESHAVMIALGYVGGADPNQLAFMVVEQPPRKLVSDRDVYHRLLLRQLPLLIRIAVQSHVPTLAQDNVVGVLTKENAYLEAEQLQRNLI